MIADKFEVKLIVDDAPLEEKMSGPDTYVITPFGAKSTFLVKEQLKEPDGTSYYEEWRFTPFTVKIQDNSAVHHDYFVKVFIDGAFASLGAVRGSTVIKGFSSESDGTATKQFCFTPPRRVGGAELGRGSTLSAERLKQLGTVRVDFHRTRLVRQEVVDDRDENTNFKGVNKEDVKKAHKAAAVATGRDIERVSGPRTMAYYESATPQNFLTSCTINYTTSEGFSFLGANAEAEEEAFRIQSNKPRVDSAFVDELVRTFGIPLEATRAGLEHVQEADLLLIPSVRKPTRNIHAEHTSMSEGKDTILGLAAEDSPAAWTSVSKAAGLNAKTFEGRSDSLLMALAHQVTCSEALGPVIRSAMAASLPSSTALEGMNDFDVLKHFATAFKCYVAVWPLGQARPILFQSPESNFGAACCVLAVNPSARGAGKGQWASLISSGQDSEEKKARRRAKRAREVCQ